MHRSTILVRTLFVFILLAGLIAGILVSTLVTVSAEPQQLGSTSIVISQVYGGGGNSGATYKYDFIELFNLGSSPVDVTGWSVQYASSTGSSWTQTSLSGMMQSGQYYLIEEAAGSGGTVNLPTPDAIGSIAMAADSGKVALVNNSTILSGACPNGIVDFVGYGSANCSESNSPAPTLSNTTADFRNVSGCSDTDNNSADFKVGAPNPRNKSFTTNCSGLFTATALAANLTATENSNLTATAASILTTTASAATPTPTATLTSTPTFTPTNTSTPTLTNTPTFNAFPAHSVVINEVAWAGTAASSSDEWMELYNSTGSNINLTGWQLFSNDGSLTITWLASDISNKIIPSGGYYLLERTDDTTVLDITADKIYTGALSNSGAALRLLDPSGFIVDSANLNGGRVAGGKRN